VEVHILSFEGPDAYARAGGIATRIVGLSEGLAEFGFPTHLWFVGDPGLPGHESQGDLHLHRWCQWISRHHPVGVYDGEEGKWRNYAETLPPYLMDEYLREAIARGVRSVIIAEEWHTVHAVLHLDWLLRREGLRDRVTILWNANNVFGFERIDWPRLAQAAVLTTVSRYMRQRMWPLGVDPIVIPNGVPVDVFAPVRHRDLAEFQQRTAGRMVLAKLARFDPDKRWLNAVEIVADLKRRGGRPLLIARGGAESHGAQVRGRAFELGLRVSERFGSRLGPPGMLALLRDLDDLDVLLLGSHVDPAARRLLFRGAHAVLANSAHEPFGLVGLETMAAGGVACTGGTGEDYAVPGQNALVLQTGDPREFAAMFLPLRESPRADARLRQAARRTARDFSWSHILERCLLPRVGLPARAAPALVAAAPLGAAPVAAASLGTAAA
jgi:glycosyltransferase involved in cell wall biosynthesis